MATLAALLKRKGHDVQGSDENVYPPMSTFLESEKIRTLSGYRAEHITPAIDLVVVGNAISRGNIELEIVLDRKVRYCSLPEAVREHFLWDATSIVIAGTHGKTTTTSLAGWLLVHGGLDPSILVGGIARNLGDDGSSYRLGQGREFVIEGDEYDSAYFDKTAKFLKYLPDIAVINNVEFDHADIYSDLDAVRLAFRRLVNLVPRTGLLLLGADSPDALALKKWAVSPVETFGLDESSDWRASDITVSNAGQSFNVTASGVAVRRDAASAVRCAQRSQRACRDRGGAYRLRASGAHRRRAGGVPGCEASARDLRRGGWSDRVRRLRPPPDRHRRDAGGSPRGESA